LYTAALACSRLRSLRLDSIKHEALSDLKHVSNTLEKLTARVLWPKLPEGYLLDRPSQLGFFAWVTCLEKLKYLNIRPLNNPTYIGIKEIVASLPTKHLAHLQLLQCVAPSDLNAAGFTHFNKLRFLSIRDCYFKTSEIRNLQKVLPYLYGIECIQHQAEDAHCLLQGKNEPTDKSTCGLCHLHLCLNFSTEESETFKELGRNQTTQSLHLSPKLKSVFISFSGNPSCCVLSLYYPSPSFSSLRLPNLDSLSVQSPLASVEKSASSGQLNSLRSLVIKAHDSLEHYQCFWPSSDSRNLPGLSTMHQMTELDLNFQCQSIDECFEEGFRAILDNMKKLRRLCIKYLKGSTYMLAPVVEMDDLCCLCLHHCSFRDLRFLKQILKSRRASIHEFEYKFSRECRSFDTCIFKLIAEILPEMARLKKLHIHELFIHFRCAAGDCIEVSTLVALPQALAKCNGLTDVCVIPVFDQWDESSNLLLTWSNVSALTKLCKLTIDTRSGWNLNSISAICCSLIYLQELHITGYAFLHSATVDVNWLIEIARLPLLRSLFIVGCRSLKLPLGLKPLIEAPSLMFVTLIGRAIQHPHAMAGRVEEVLPNIQKCNIVH